MEGMEQHQSLTLHVSEGHPVSTLHVPDSSMTLNDVLKVNGFTPRDGSFRFLVDEQGTMINHREAGRAPPTVRCGVPVNVEQLWIDDDARRGFAPAVCSNGEEVFVLNGKAFDFQTVFVTRWKRGKEQRRVAYGFSPEAPFYATSDLVFLQIPTKGDTGRIYNPQSGRVDRKIRLQAPPGEIEGMRGFWSAWQLQPDLERATYRADITPLPVNFKPHIPSRPKPTKASPSKRKRKIKLKKIKEDAWGEGMHKSVLQLHNHWAPTLVCGVPKTPNGLEGVLVANGNANRPAMVNLDGFQYGMTQCIKIPAQGETYSIYAPAQKDYVSCVIESSKSLVLEELRGRWVIARLQRSNQHKRKLVLEALPSQLTSK
ncbi:MAG: hypothetical protein CMP64_06960 [Flavobacteriales bacterium]|nr:hypothetical protein [Flavobacteriales bacterium]